MTDVIEEIKRRWFTNVLHHPNYWADLASRDIPLLTDEVVRLRGLLARLEWLPNYAYGADGSTRICFACDMLESTGHTAGCWLATELGTTKAAP